MRASTNPINLFSFPNNPESIRIRIYRRRYSADLEALLMFQLHLFILFLFLLERYWSVTPDNWTRFLFSAPIRLRNENWQFYTMSFKASSFSCSLFGFQSIFLSFFPWVKIHWSALTVSCWFNKEGETTIYGCLEMRFLLMMFLFECCLRDQ